MTVDFLYGNGAANHLIVHLFIQFTAQQVHHLLGVGVRVRAEGGGGGFGVSWAQHAKPVPICPLDVSEVNGELVLVSGGGRRPNDVARPSLRGEEVSQVVNLEGRRERGKGNWQLPSVPSKMFRSTQYKLDYMQMWANTLLFKLFTNKEVVAKDICGEDLPQSLRCCAVHSSQ